MYETIHGVRFYTRPKVYVFGETKFNSHEFVRFLSDQKLTVNEDQLTGSDAEKVVEAGARACYLSFGKGCGTKEHLENIRASNHGSVTRHATCTLMITGVSRGLTHELVRHGVGTAISQTSTRYIDAKELGFVVPPEFQGKADLERDYEGACFQALSYYEEAVAHLIAQGLSRKAARGAARAFLPIGLAQIIQFSFNIQSYRHVLRMHGALAAEAEIRYLAREMAPIAKYLWPNLCNDVDVTAAHLDGADGVRLGDNI